MNLLPRRLNYRTALLVLVVLCITGIISGWVSATRQSNRLIADVREHSSVMVRHFAENCARFLVLGDYAELEDFLLKSVELPNVMRLQICEPDGHVVGDISRKQDGKLVMEMGNSQISPPDAVVPSYKISGEHMIFWHPITAGNELGWIRADFSLASIKRAQVEAWTQNLILELFWIIGSIAMILFVLRPTAVALDKLAGFARGLNEHKGEQISVGDDAIEIKTLEESLNHASEQLQLAERQLLSDQERLSKHIAERRETEERLQESEERLRLTLDATQIGIWDWDIKNDIWYASPVYYSMLGYPPKAGVADRDEWLPRVHPDDQRGVLEKIQDVLSRDFTEYLYEARVRHADGSYRWQYVRGFGIRRDDDGKVTRMLGIRMDIDERKRAEEKLRMLNEQLDQRIKERTAELEEKNTELERMNKIFVGRELRMIELKERIEELEIKLGTQGEHGNSADNHR